MISPSTPYARTENLRFKIYGVPNGGPELCLALDMRGDPVAGHPREMARFAQIGASGTTEEDVTKSVQSMTWVNDQTFNSGFSQSSCRALLRPDAFSSSRSLYRCDASAISVSTGLLTLRPSSWLTCTYFIVVSTSLCPISFCTV